MIKLKIGIVGVGFIADWHFNAFKDHSDAEVIGLCRDYYGDRQDHERQKKALEDKCEELNVQAYRDYNEMVVDDNIDAIVIGSVNPLHLSQIKKALSNGKHVMVEKPVVTELEHLVEIETLSNNSNAKVFPAHNFVYRQSVIKAKEAIDHGEVGDIIHASFTVTQLLSDYHAQGWRAKKELSSGGALMDSGHHLVYQTLYLLGRPVKLQAFQSKKVWTSMDGEDLVQVSLLYPDGSMVSIMQSWASEHESGINGIRIVGNKGSIVITDGLYVNGELRDKDVEYGSSFKNQAKAFTDYVFYDHPPKSGIEEIRDTLRIIHGAYESAETSSVIDF